MINILANARILANAPLPAMISRICLSRCSLHHSCTWQSLGIACRGSRNSSSECNKRLASKIRCACTCSTAAILINRTCGLSVHSKNENLRSTHCLCLPTFRLAEKEFTKDESSDWVAGLYLHRFDKEMQGVRCCRATRLVNKSFIRSRNSPPPALAYDTGPLYTSHLTGAFGMLACSLLSTQPFSLRLPDNLCMHGAPSMHTGLTKQVGCLTSKLK